MIEQLKQIVSIVINPDSSNQQIELALTRYIDICSYETGISPDITFDAFAQDSYLEQGLAINPQAAARCVDDIKRTTAFIRGIKQAIEHLLKPSLQNKSLSPIKILYAGTGPYATLLLPLLSQFSSKSLSIELLDIHQESLNAIKKVLAYFELLDFNITFHCLDACDFKPNKQYDLIISEVMQKALEQEPQFMVTYHLTPLLSKKGIFIPEAIDVSLQLCEFDQKSLISNNTIQKWPLISLTTNNVIQLYGQRFKHNGESHIPLQNIDCLQWSGKIKPVLFTHIKIYKHIQLIENDSDLTKPVQFFAIENIEQSSNVTITYQLGNYPKIDYIL